ncbi:MAG TPA: hypothetical protein VKA50_08970 [Gammaproteobacteria bacterium]|nr:hypothetical protein [Gammaproteobacteria bacterium]
MKHRIVIALGGAVVMALSAWPAWAEQTVTLNVPVKLSNLYSDVKTFSVGCKIQKSQSVAGALSYGRVDLPVSNGGYNGTVHVKVSVPDSYVAQAKYWSCTLYLFHAGAGNGCKPEVNAAAPACKAKPGTQLVNHIEGPLQQQFSPSRGLRFVPRTQ